MDQARLMNEKVPDSELVAAVRAGDPAAFEELFRRNQRRVYSVALNFFGGRTQAAEDVTQQVFLKFYTNVKRFRGDAKISTWLYRITVNLCIDEQKRRRRFSFFGDLFEKDESVPLEEPAQAPGSFELEDEVRRAVAELKPVFRIPVVLKHVEGMSYSEMAEVMDCSEGTIASRLSRGHKLLAEKLVHLRDER
jgi:RNA polymerase sigma-70 factor (ECF subfamily)